MSLEMLCTKQIFENGCTPEAISEYHSLVRHLTYTTNDAVAFSEIVMMRGHITSPISEETLECLQIEDITCDDIRNRHKISTKCISCSNCKDNKKQRREMDQAALTYLISVPANKNLKMFPKDDVEGNKILAKFESVENLYGDATKGDDYGPLFGYMYMVVRRIVCSNIISGKVPVYKELSTEIFAKQFAEQYPEYAENEGIQEHFMACYKWICGRAAEFAAAFSGLSSSAKASKIKKILGDYRIEEQDNKNKDFLQTDVTKTQKEQTSKEASFFDDYEEVGETTNTNETPEKKNISEELESFIEEETFNSEADPENNEQATLKVHTLRPTINNGWIKLFGFDVPEESSKGAGKLAYYFLRSAVPTVEVAYNTDSHAYGFLVMFPDIAQKMYITESSRLVGTLLPFLAHRTLYHFFTSNFIGVAALCIHNGSKPENVTQVDVSRFIRDNNKPDTFIAYVDHWQEYKNDFTSCTEMYFQRALGRSLYISDVSPYESPYVNVNETFNFCELKNIKTKGYLLVKLLFKSMFAAGEWLKITKSMVAAFEEKGVMAKHNIRLAEIDQGKEYLYFIVPEGEYRAFHTLLTRTAMNRYRQQNKIKVRVEATPLEVK